MTTLYATFGWHSRFYRGQKWAEGQVLCLDLVVQQGAEARRGVKMLAITTLRQIRAIFWVRMAGRQPDGKFKKSAVHGVRINGARSQGRNRFPKTLLRNSLLSFETYRPILGMALAQ
jgi:hypothetical protein